MPRRRRLIACFAILASTSILAASCGNSDDDGGDAGFIDYAQLADRGSNTSFDPAVVQTVDEAQLTTAVWDGLTDFDFTDKLKPVLKGSDAETWKANEDATQWVFTLKKDHEFSNGEPVLPSSYKGAWERAGSKELASPYGYLITFIKGGAALQDGSAKTLDSIKVDDEAMTLTVEMETPNADFPAIVNHSFFSPLSATELKSLGTKPVGWADAAKIGNGPFKIETLNTNEVVLVENDKWAGNIYGETKTKSKKITFKITAEVDSAFQSFDSGQGDSATVPSGRYKEALAKYPNTVKSPTMRTDFLDLGAENPALTGEKNLKLRKAISLSIDRQKIIDTVFEGTRTVAGGITPPGIPGYEANLCDYCEYDPAEAKKLVEEWKAEGGSLSSPLKLQFNGGGGHEDTFAIIQASLKAAGIEAELDPIAEDYFKVIADPGACNICRSGWQADYPTYGNFMFDLFGKASIGGNNLGRYDNPEFEALIADAASQTDDDTRGELYRSAEEQLINISVAAVPLYFSNGDQVYRKGVTGYDQSPLGFVLWERVSKG